ncbi:SDR family NAD(P)-dependent oxidoreductase [Streptomyces triticagri]|uniref:SDR family NAD(P)-dependent oxidoreductase n=1 Tax=Streptomyces triticagri TaxID=2293568 RepID=A0A372M0A5_9ACTN|nr:3-oxoacyl-ACP reductase FabG [Streptomyces triticagri]RFU83717.1 SDR family NAD(P)-dependent oxidoreductase [Streptomyces triticagri]
MQQRRSALVTGGSRGIGRAVAVRLARAGYDVGFCSRSAGEESLETARLIGEAGARAHHVVCDVTDTEAVRTFVDETEEKLGPAYAVVNSAGVLRDRPLALMAADDWRAVVGTSLDGTFNVSRAVVRGLITRRTGALVNVSSVIGVYGNAGQTNYAAAKGGLNGLTRALAKEVAPYGVRVNAVAPGFIETEMLDGMTAKAREAALGRIAMGRFGSAESVAELVSFLVSDAADYITGQVVQVDGGIAL